MLAIKAEFKEIVDWLDGKINSPESGLNPKLFTKSHPEIEGRIARITNPLRTKVLLSLLVRVTSHTDKFN